MKYKTLLISLLTVFLWTCKEEHPAQVEEVVRPVRFGKVRIIKNPNRQTFSGIVKSAKEATLGFKVPGAIGSITVKLGEKVEKSQLLATLEAGDFQTEHKIALANAQKAEVEVYAAISKLATSKSNYERIEKLYEMNSVTIAEYEQAKADHEIAGSSCSAVRELLVLAEKQVEAEWNRVGYSKLVAPFSGIITAILHEENETVGIGDPIIKLNSEDQLEANIWLTEVFIHYVRQGQEVDIRHVSFQDEGLSGKVHEVGFSTEGTSTFPVTVLIAGQSKQIRPGSIVDITLDFNEHVEKQDYLVASKKGVGGTASHHFAFLLKPSGEIYEVKKQPVSIGTAFSEDIEITKGLKDGDLIATAGLNSLKEGMRVKLLIK